MATIFNFSLLVTSYNIHISTVEFLDLENVEVALEMVLLSCIQADVEVL